MNLDSFVLLDLLWGEEGILSEKVSSLFEPHIWVDPTNGDMVNASLKEIMLLFEGSSGLFINYNFSGNPIKKSYDESGLLKSVEKFGVGLIQIVKELESKGYSTKQYITRCSRCGKWYYATLNTFVRRNGLFCKDCSSDVNLIRENGSLLDARPDILPYWSDKNSFTPNECPIGGSTVLSREYWLVCRYCGKEVRKSAKAIISSGASCTSCSRRNNVRGQDSLREKYPSVAVMFDKAENYDKMGNRLYSNRVHATANGEFSFHCDGGGIPHTFRKSLGNVVLAHKNGTVGCPICAGFEVREGVNDFATKVPELARYWDEVKNGISVSKVYYNDRKEYWWICPNGHSFKRDPMHMGRSVGTSTLGCPVCHGKDVREGVNDVFTVRPDLMKYWDFSKNTELVPTEVTSQSNISAWWKCSKCGKSFLYRIDHMSRTNGLCEECRKSNYSKCEKELALYIKSLGFWVEEGAHVYSNPSMSADIYIPSKKIVIEYNGLYWHSDAVRENPLFHYNKYTDLKSKGIFLYTVWDDDYNSPKKDVILKSIKRLLGVSSERKVNARDCDVQFVDKYSALMFMSENHIQGFVSGSDYVGLYTLDTNELVAVAVFLDNHDGYIRLSRYATCCNVRGGLSKIISVVKECNSDRYSGILTFSDNLISRGRLYETCGFRVVSELKPDYMYLYNGVRVHKFNFRKSRFERDPNLLYKDGLTERQLAELNGLPRIYDAGKLKWYYQF